MQLLLLLPCALFKLDLALAAGLPPAVAPQLVSWGVPPAAAVHVPVTGPTQAAAAVTTNAPVMRWESSIHPGGEGFGPTAVIAVQVTVTTTTHGAADQVTVCDLQKEEGGGRRGSCILCGVRFCC